MTAQHSTTSSDDTTRKVDLNLTQVIAAALAAVTAAVLGSKLGIAGTVIGAAGASVTLTVGTAVYRASLEHSQQKIRSLAQRTRPLLTLREEGRAHPSPPAGDAALGEEQLTSEEQLTDGADREGEPEARSPWYARLRWGTVVVGALGGFVLAMMLITGFEWASGETLGDNGRGTTIGQVVQAPPGPQDPVAPPAPSSETSPSETPTGTTTAPGTTTTPGGGAGVDRVPATTSTTPTPSEVRPTPPLIPTRLPAPGG